MRNKCIRDTGRRELCQIIRKICEKQTSELNEIENNGK